MSADPTPTPAGCHLMTPPPGGFGAVECNFDQQYAAMGSVFEVLAVILIAAGAIVVLAGFFSAVSGRPPFPAAVWRRLRRAPATPRDQRLVGAGVMSGGVAVLISALGASSIATQPAGSGLIKIAPLFSLMFLVLAAVLALSARHRDRQSGEVLSTWDELSRAVRG